VLCLRGPTKASPVVLVEIASDPPSEKEALEACGIKKLAKAYGPVLCVAFCKGMALLLVSFFVLLVFPLLGSVLSKGRNRYIFATL